MHAHVVRLSSSSQFSSYTLYSNLYSNTVIRNTRLHIAGGSQSPACLSPHVCASFEGVAFYRPIQDRQSFKDS